MVFPAEPTQIDMLSIYLALSQYPILSSRIRARMRSELFERGVIDPQAFEAEVREKAIQSRRNGRGCTTRSARKPPISGSSA